MRQAPAHVDLGSLARTLSFFDGLALERLTAAELVQRTAAWSDRPLGVTLRDGTLLGSQATGRVSHRSVQGHVIALGGTPEANDDLLVSRLAITLDLCEDAGSGTRAALTTATAVEALIDRAVAPEAQQAAMAHLAVSRTTPCHVLLVRGDPAQIELLEKTMRTGGIRLALCRRERLTVILALGPLRAALVERIPVGLEVGLSAEHPVSATAQAYREARAAYRFSQPSPRDNGPYRLEEGVAVRFDLLMGFDVFTETMTPDVIERMPDVHKLDMLIEQGGPDMLATLDTIVAATSVRHAARLLGVHHNSVAHRVASAERRLGFSIADNYGRCRLFVALMLRRMRNTHHLVQADDGGPT